MDYNFRQYLNNFFFLISFLPNVTSRNLTFVLCLNTLHDLFSSPIRRIKLFYWWLHRGLTQHNVSWHVYDFPFICFCFVVDLWFGGDVQTVCYRGIVRMKNYKSFSFFFSFLFVSIRLNYERYRTIVRRSKTIIKTSQCSL